MPKRLVVTYEQGVYPPKEISREWIDFPEIEKTQFEKLEERVKAIENQLGINPS